MKIIAPSVLSSDFSRLGEEIRAVESAGADWIHVDVMDGHFVPNITLGPMIVKAVKSVTRLPIDVHLMIERPELYIDKFAEAGADLISVHAETCPHLNRTVTRIIECECKAGVAVNPSTPLSALEWILEYLDFVLIMSVNPGFGGQDFIPSCIDKIRSLRQMIEKMDLNVIIEVDGGIKANTIGAVNDAGADAFVAGSAIFGADDYKKAISELKRLIRKDISV